MAKPITVIFACVCFVSTAASAEVLTPEERNILAACEAGATTVAMLAYIVGASGTCLTFGGSFSDSGWVTEIHGYYSCWPADFSLSGRCAPGSAAGDYTFSGEACGGSWEGSGTWDFTEESDASESLAWDCSALYEAWWTDIAMSRYSNVLKELTKHAAIPDTTISGSGTYDWVVDGSPWWYDLPEDVELVIPAGDPGAAAVDYAMPDDHVYVTATANLTTGRIHGTIGVFGPSSTESATWGSVKALFR